MEEKKLTDEDIVKVMKCCAESCLYCDECPLREDSWCSNKVLPMGIDLIHRQKAEIERLTEELKNERVCRSTMAIYEIELKKANDKNAELQKQVDELQDRLASVLVGIKADELLCAKGVEQAVKDTTKEILITAIQLSDMCESFYEFQNRLIDLIEVNYNVEIAQETIIPAKGVEVE